jgi:hypothetical protein
MVELQEQRQQSVAVERALLVVLAQPEIRIAHQRDLYLAMVHIYKVAQLAVWPVLKEAVVVVVVTTAAAAVLIKLDQLTAAVVVARAT